jgi:uncharacterized membrane protein YvbJ
MQCKQCGTEIADKAIVCYRCGTSTTEPVRKAVPIKPKSSPIVPLVIVAVLMAVAVYLWSYARTAANADLIDFAAGLSFGAAVTVLIVTVLRRRR